MRCEVDEDVGRYFILPSISTRPAKSKRRIVLPRLQARRWPRPTEQKGCGPRSIRGSVSRLAGARSPLGRGGCVAGVLLCASPIGHCGHRSGVPVSQAARRGRERRSPRAVPFQGGDAARGEVMQYRDVRLLSFCCCWDRRGGVAEQTALELVLAQSQKSGPGRDAKLKHVQPIRVERRPTLARHPALLSSPPPLPFHDSFITSSIAGRARAQRRPRSRTR